ncbi:MAG: transporter [Planctomycetota bacterium]
MKQLCPSILLASLYFLLAPTGEVVAQDDEPGFTTSDTNVGYIDSAIPATQFRLRIDSAFDNPTPDRAEFFYRASMSATGDPLSPAETNVDYNDVTSYFELAFSPDSSVFLEAPFRFLNPELNDNVSGFGDLMVGAKTVLWRDPSQIYTGQFRVYLPTGDDDRLLGTDHVSLEPSLLAAHRLGPMTMLESELRLWIPIDGTEFAGEQFSGPIIRFGLGLGRDLYRETSACDCETKRLTAVAELVGWSILDGLATVPASPSLARLIDVTDDTIVNAKLGLRWTDDNQSVFIGYGQALTGDVWYHNIVRAEYVIRF